MLPVHVFTAIPLSTALPAPNVSISPASGSPTAGQTYSLTCSVQVVPHLVVEPSIEWTRQDGTVLIASSGSSLQLNFNPVVTSNSSHYTCRASIDITGVVSVSGENTRDLEVISKYHTVYSCMCHVVFSITPCLNVFTQVNYVLTDNGY